MARGIEAGGKIRIEGREFTVENVLDNSVDGQRSIYVRLRWDEPAVEDSVPWDRDVYEPETFDLSSAAVLESIDLSPVLDFIETTFKNLSETEVKSFTITNLLKGFNQ
jgi:hypothetical protein